jgi:DNA-binding NarL/FixJ family response regulator
MRVLLINPPASPGRIASRTYAGGLGVLASPHYGDDEDVDVLLPPVDLAACATALRHRHHDVALCDFAVDETAAVWIDRVVASAAHLVVALVSLPAYREDCDLLRAFKTRSPATRLILLTAVQDDDVLKEMLSLSAAEKVVHPDGVSDLPDIVENIEVTNTAWLDEAAVLRKGPRDTPEDLDALPSPAWELLRHPGYRYELDGFPARNFTALATSVGCPYPCSYYCPYPLAQGTRVRTHSLDRVIVELMAIELAGFDGVVFTDPVFTIDRKRTMDLCARMSDRGIRLSWACETRIDRLDYDLLHTMRRAGCVGVEVGVESGDPVVLTQQAKAGLTLDAVHRFKAWTDDLGIAPTFLFLIGLPMETRQSIERTLRFIRALHANPDQMNVAVITPYPGTRLYADAVARQWILRPHSDFSGFTPVMRTDALSLADISYAKRLADELLILLRQETAAGNGATERFFEKVEVWVRDGRTT